MCRYIHRRNIKWDKDLRSCSFFVADLFQEAIWRSQSGLFGAQVAQTIGERSLPAEGAVRATALVNRDELHIVWECMILTGQENQALTRWGPASKATARNPAWILFVMRSHWATWGKRLICVEQLQAGFYVEGRLVWSAVVLWTRCGVGLD